MAGYNGDDDAYGTFSNMSYKDALLEGETEHSQQQPLRQQQEIQQHQQQQKQQHARSSNSRPKSFRGNASRKDKRNENNSENNDDDRDGTKDLKSSMIISGAVIAVIGAFFAIIKNMKEA